jgi:hypothetical protein
VERLASSKCKRPSHASSMPVKYARIIPPKEGYARVLQSRDSNLVRGAPSRKAVGSKRRLRVYIFSLGLML